QHRIGDRQRVEEAGAHGVHVESDAVVDPERRLDLGCGRWKSLVGRRGRKHDDVDVAGVDAGMIERAARGLGSEAARRLPVRRDVAVADTGALDDPLIGRVDGLGQFLIGNAARWQRAANAGDDRAARHSAASLAKAWARKLSRSSPIFLVMSLRTMLAATRIALATPFELAPPWLFTISPLRPRKTAPLWLLGSRWCLSKLSAGRDRAKPAFDLNELLNARRSKSVTKRAVPSAVLSAILPEKPSVTTTSTAPRD